MPLTKELKVLGEYQDVDSEIKETVKKVNSDMDMEWIKEHEASEGEINITSPTKDKEQEEELDDIMDVLRGEKTGDTTKIDGLPITDLSEDNKISKQEEPIKEEPNMKSLEFAEYAGELMEKYHADDYHRMMTEEETNKYVNLYSEAFNADRKEALDMVKDTISKQLNREKTEDEINKQGLEQDTLMNMSIEYRDKYGSNFMAYLNDEELEKYTVQYLHAYDRKRSDVDKMYQDSLDRAYNEKLEPLNKSLSGLTYGKVEGDRMNDNDRERVNEELRKMTQGLSKEQMSPFYDTSYTEVGGAALPSNVSKQADQIIEAMANNQIDTNGNPIVENEMTNNKQMGYIKVGVLSIMSIAVSMGILVLGVMIGG